MSTRSRVATLIANPERPVLTDALIARAAQELQGFTGSRWLDKGVAADLDFTGEAGALAQMAEEAGVDAIVQPAAHREKRLLVADMDSTLIGQECIDELAAAIGIGERVAAITERAMRGEIEFAGALRERVALLTDLPLATLDKVLATRITLTPGARKLVRTMRARGGYVAIVSGGFTPFTGEIARRLEANEHRANVLEVAADRLTGRVREPILGSDAKKASLIELREKHGLAREQTLAVGDGANDLEMIGEAGLGVAFRAKPKVAAAADARIEHSDLTALLYAQGIARADFVED